MYHFYNLFLPANTTSITFLDPDPPALSPAAIVSLAIGITVILSGAVYCGWRCFRAYYGNENRVTPIDLPAPEVTRTTLRVIRNEEGKITRIQRVYVDQSILEIEPSEDKTTATIAS